MSILNHLDSAGADIPGTEQFRLETDGLTLTILGRRTRRPKGKSSSGEERVESEGLWLNLYTDQEMEVGWKIRRLSDDVQFQIDDVDVSWRGRRQTVRCTRLRGVVA